MENKKYKKVSTEDSIYIRYLYQDMCLRGITLLERFPQYSKSSVYRHAVLPLGKL